MKNVVGCELNKADVAAAQASQFGSFYGMRKVAPPESGIAPGRYTTVQPSKISPPSGNLSKSKNIFLEAW